MQRFCPTFDKGVAGHQNIQIMYWRLLRLDCLYDGNGREPGGRIPQVSVIDHQRKLHIHSVLCCLRGRVVEILRHRVCTCIHARTYLYKIGTCCLSLSAYMGRIAVLRAAPKHPMTSFLIDFWFWACRQIRTLDCRTESFARR